MQNTVLKLSPLCVPFFLVQGLISRIQGTKPRLFLEDLGLLTGLKKEEQNSTDL